MYRGSVMRATILVSTVTTLVCCLTLPSARKLLGQAMCLSVSSSGPVWASAPFVSSQGGIFTAAADATPLGSGTDSAVGLSLGPQSNYTGLAAIARFNSAGYLDVRNGSGYASDAVVQYTPGRVHHLRFEVNVVTHTYSVYVTPPGATEIQIAGNYAFRTEQNSVTALNYFSVFADAGAMQACNLQIPCETAASGYSWFNVPFNSQSAGFTAQWDATPSDAGLDGVMALSTAAGTTFTNFAALVRFGTNGQFDARNGSTYASDTVIPYAAGTQYHIRAVVNFAAHTYSVFVTPPGAAEIQLANNYAFRTEQSGASSLANFGAIVDSTFGSVRICNFNITPSTTPSTYDQVVLADNPVAFWDVNATSSTEADLSGNGNNGTYPGGLPPIAIMPNGDAAADFNGTNQYVTVNSNPSFSISTTGDFTWEAWIRPDTLQFPNSSPDRYVDFMGKCDSYSPTCEWESRMYNTTTPQGRCNRLSAYAFNPTANLGSGADWQPVCGLIQAGQWLHVVGEYTINQTQYADCSTPPPGSIDIWVNGVEWNQSYHGQTGCMSQYNVRPQPNSSPLNIGTMAYDTWFAGAIGKVAIYNYRLTQTQINRHYEAMTGSQPTGSCTSNCSF
jgi:hypothetical protein